MVWKKYTFLDDHKTLYEKLKDKSMMEMAKELAEGMKRPELVMNLFGSIRYRVMRYFTEEERKLLKRDRDFNKKSKGNS